MFSDNLKLRVSLILLVVGLVAAVPAYAGSAVIGSVAGSMNASIGGQALLPNSTIFSGDSLEVKDGAAVVAMGGGNRMVFGRETVASFLRESNEVTVLLGQGNVSMYHPDDSVALRVKAGEVAIEPAKGYKTLGEVAMVNGAVVVTTKEGLLRVENGTGVKEVEKGKTVTVLPQTARAPQGGAAGAGGGVAHMSASTGLAVGAVAGSVTSSILSAVAISRANDARDAAAAAGATAAQAVTAANAATAAANAAIDAANAAAATTNAVGCALNVFAVAEGIPNATSTSPYHPPSGTC